MHFFHCNIYLEKIQIEQKLFTASFSQTILTFIEWYDLQQISRTVPFTTRDLVAWMTFIKDSAGNTGFSKNCCSIIHGICLVIIDGLATVLRGEALTNFVLEVKQLFEKNMNNHGQCDCFDWILPSGGSSCQVLIDENQFSIGPFSISKQDSNPYKGNFQFQSETVTKNALKLLRGLQLQSSSAILMEGSPGVGKSSIVAALGTIHILRNHFYKGQLISECLFDIVNFQKKQRKI